MPEIKIANQDTLVETKNNTEVIKNDFDAFLGGGYTVPAIIRRLEDIEKQIGTPNPINADMETVFNFIKQINDKLDNQSGGSSAIKKILRGVHNGAANAGNITITHNKNVNPDNCFILLNQARTDQNIKFMPSLVSVSANSFVVTASSDITSSYQARTFSWQLIEFN